MMHTRAYLLLEKEFLEYEEANIFGISLNPVENNLMEWVAEIGGLKDSLWEGAELQLSLRYNENYNNIPPRVNFNTIPFHPNVDPQSGRPCVDFLDDLTKWNPKFTITSILLSIQVLLSNPVLDNAVNLEAAIMLENNYPLYRQRVIQCVEASQNLGDIAEKLEIYPPPIKFLPPPEENVERAQVRKIKAISYEDYYLTWFKLATSKAVENFKTPVFDDPDFIGNHYEWTAMNVGKGEWDANIHQLIVFGVIERFKKQKLIETRTVSHHVPNPTPVTGSQMTSESRKTDIHLSRSSDVEPWEKEAEDLVMWSASLDKINWN
ncbi:ubiquitin-conjugating enzyme E2 U isoform X2 [Sceloporus undulatus]|uniref:ubiquitin-conjugating enzyme E2 U isoform X2 n=1 Tax=Sceloporus undulatus TaxID=8520 RepID=UPI001C4CE439|nr:ubiquitin-conjugating enzyme E2 U isoform X2 [Sceloporus undulatus]